jgi:hypothetical protein
MEATFLHFLHHLLHLLELLEQFIHILNLGPRPGGDPLFPRPLYDVWEMPLLRRHGTDDGF